MTPTFKSQQRLQKWLSRESRLSESFVRYNKATIVSIYLLIQKDLFMRDLQSA